MINIFQPSLGEEEVIALRKLFKTNWLGRGPVEKKFVESLSKRLRTSSEEGGFTNTPLDKLTT